MLACVQDIEGVDPEYYKNLTWLLEHDMTDVVDLNFVEEVDYFGRVEHVELKPGGRDIKVPAVLNGVAVSSRGPFACTCGDLLHFLCSQSGATHCQTPACLFRLLQAIGAKMFEAHCA